MNKSTAKPKEFKRDEHKLKELIVYIAMQTADSKKFGRTHLNKVLAWSDFIMYAHTGKPIVGGDYCKLDNGPVVDNYQTVLNQLIKERAVAEQVVPNLDYATRKLVATREPDLTIFTGSEIAQVDRLIERLKGKTATAISLDSHDYFVGWEVSSFGTRIPYETVFLPTSYKPTAAEEAHTRELAAKFNW